MTLHDDLVEEINRLGPDTTLNTQQAAALLGMSEHALEKQRETERQNPGSETAIPFHRNGRRVVYYLLDLLRRAARGPHGLPEPFKILANFMGEEFCNEIGLPSGGNRWPATRQRPYPALELPSTSLADMAAGMVSSTVPEQKKRGPKPSKAMHKKNRELELAGAQVRTHVCPFGSLNDFLRGAEPDEEWLFACTPDERPFDFMDALQEGSEAPFIWLSLSDYLAQLSEAAINDRGRRLAEEERDLLLSDI